MLNVIKGRLGRDPELTKRVSRNSQEEFLVTNNVVYVWTGEKGENVSDVPVPITAFNEQAKELSKYGKGDLIEFIGMARSVEVKDRRNDSSHIAMGYTVQYIDHSQNIYNEFNTVLKDHMAAERDKSPFADMDGVKEITYRPDNRMRNNSQNRERRYMEEEK